MLTLGRVSSSNSFSGRLCTIESAISQHIVRGTDGDATTSVEFQYKRHLTQTKYAPVADETRSRTSFRFANSRSCHSARKPLFVLANSWIAMTSCNERVRVIRLDVSLKDEFCSRKMDSQFLF
jgi:hypothetical protein